MTLRHPRDGQGAEAMLARLRRDTLWVGTAMTVVTLLVWPDQPRRAGGVLGGVLLMALAYLGIRAGVDAAVARLDVRSEGPDGREPGDEMPRKAPIAAGAGGFVKFFTRHGMLALGAYVMIARFELHPVAMLAGVTAPAVAAGLEFVRVVRARGTGSHSRSS
jgi:hypothetical protein